MITIYGWLADIVLFLHVLVVAFVVLGLIVTLIGGLANWHWVRNPWFRTAHLACILIVVIQAWSGVVCPLTTLEMWLRNLAGQHSYNGSFITYWLSKILFHDLPAWAFTLCYSVFGLIVAGSWFWVRPRPFTKR